MSQAASYKFELEMYERDFMGHPTDRRVLCQTDSADELYEFWMLKKGRQVNKSRKPKKTKGKLPSATQASDILKKMYNGEK